MERKNLSDLPADLQKSISDFRNIAPGHHVVREAFARIYRLKSEESRQPAKALLERSKISKSWNDKLSLNIGLTWVFAVAAVLIALASVQQWAEQPLRPVKYIHNVAVNLATSSKGLFSFDLLMHHHRGRDTQLEIKAPAHVKVDPGKLLMASRCSQSTFSRSSKSLKTHSELCGNLAWKTRHSPQA